MNTMKIDKDAWVENSILKGNIEVGPGVLIQDSFIVGNFKITSNEKFTNIVDSVIVGEGEIHNCCFQSSKLNLTGKNINSIIEHCFYLKERTFNNDVVVENIIVSEIE